ncbi:hypothetical protein [Desulfuromonas thiophila]|nr:hypothetical protein [Desulfuromonas thiophila]
MDDSLYYLMGAVITGGALICFLFASFSDHREQSGRRRRSLYSRINRQ